MARGGVMLEPGFEQVYTMTDFYDGPRRGIADFYGKPHLYVSEWNEKLQDFQPEYTLSPVSNEVFSLAMEAWSIWVRWKTAFNKGETTLETHPALLQDQTRYEELREVLAAKLVVHKTEIVISRGLFKRIDDPNWDGFGPTPLQVHWTVIKSISE
jgi:hypothetical protein